MKIVELHLLTSDIDETEMFYNLVLGCATIVKSNNHVSLQAGNSLLIFHLAINKNPVYHFAFTVHSDLMLQAYDSISKQAKMISGINGEKIIDFSAWQAKAFYFFDNNGNVVECISRRPIDDSILLSEKFIYSISEAGLVMNDVNDATQNFINNYNFSHFERQAKHTGSFTVLGDDHGLLILVPPGRDWYPTEITSLPFWCKVKCKVLDNTIDIEVN